MTRSEIFDSFVKIAQEKGMISEDAPEKAQKKLEKERRADSLDISAIEALYGTKPDLPKDMQYKKNIIEDAHPNSVVISPAYDKLNGLVENDQERQNIILNILSKPPHGHLIQPKYAEKDFVMTLVRIGNALDAKKEAELTTLADTCLQQATHKSFKKEGVAPVVIVLVVAAVIGYYYAQQHLPNGNYGMEANLAKLLDEIKDLIEQETHWYGSGYKINPQVKQDMTKFRDNLLKFWQLYKKNEPVMQELQRPKDAQELMEQAKKPETGAVLNSYQELIKSIEMMLPFIEQVETNFNSQSYKDSMIQDRGWAVSLIDSIRIGDTPLLHGGYGLFLDDFDDIVHAIQPFKKSCQQMLEVFKKAQSLQADAKAKLQNAQMESSQLFGSKPGGDSIPGSPSGSPSGSPLGSPSGSPSGKPKDNEFNTSIEDLEKDLAGGLQ